MRLIQDIPRDFTRADWHKIWRIMRKNGYVPLAERADESALAERAALGERVRDVAEHGRVCVVTSGRDCDCVEYVHSTLRDVVPLVALWHDRADAFAWADGPMAIGYCAPSERPRSASRDLAMEAFENGHAHYVTSATA